MDFQFGGNAAGFSRRERFIQRSEFVRVQIVHHQDDRVCLREMDVDQVTQAVGKVNHGAARCHLDMTPGLQRCEKEKEVAGAVAFILVVIFGHRTRSRWQGQTGLFGQLFTAFIHENASTRRAQDLAGWHDCPVHPDRPDCWDCSDSRDGPFPTDSSGSHFLSWLISSSL